jgi:hypothetical protein
MTPTPDAPPQDADVAAPWLVDAWADGCTYRVIAACPTLAEAAAVAAQHAGAFLLFRSSPPCTPRISGACDSTTPQGTGCPPTHTP